MSTQSIMIEYRTEILDAPEVKGPAAYLTPRRATWRASTWPRAGDLPREVWIHVLLSGPGRSGHTFSVPYADGTVPDWVPRPPDGWLASLEVLR